MNEAKFVLRWRHINLWSMHGNIDYAPSPEVLEEKKRELELFNPHFEYWIERYLGG